MNDELTADVAESPDDDPDVADADLPTDEEESASPPPDDDSSAPVDPDADGGVR
jgi:hypothetical protein